MGTNRNLKAYVRYDGSGRVIAGSLILRKNKPKVGNFQEVRGYQCCNVDQSPVLMEVGSFPMSYASMRVQPNDGNFYQPINAYTDQTAANIDALAALFNASFKNLGFFKVVDGDLYWTPSVGIADFYAANHTTSLSASAFSD